MKMVDTFKHHKTHKYTITGFVVGGMLLLVSIVDILVIKKPWLHPLSVYMTLIPGALIVLRSLRPPIGVLRGITTYAGGTLIGVVPMLLTSDSQQFLWAGVACGLTGAAFLGVSFTEKPKKVEHVPQ
jgi:hypothetical protein